MHPLENSPPNGFTVNRLTNDVFEINHRRTGMGCMNIFLVVWMTGWTVGCVAVSRAYLTDGSIGDGQSVNGFIVLGLLLGEILVGSFLLFSLFGRRNFLFDETRFVMETRVLAYKRLKIFDRSKITAVSQIKDGGGSDDSFPSWGLKVTCGRKATSVLFRQPHEKSLWLGDVIANWAGVSFSPIPDD